MKLIPTIEELVDNFESMDYTKKEMINLLSAYQVKLNKIRIILNEGFEDHILEINRADVGDKMFEDIKKMI